MLLRIMTWQDWTYLATLIGLPILIVLLFLFFSRKQTLHVAIWGNDAKGLLRGTLFRPYCTVQAALNKLNPIISKPTTIKIHTGDYLWPKQMTQLVKDETGLVLAYPFLFIRKGCLIFQGVQKKDKLKTTCLVK